MSCIFWGKSESDSKVFTTRGVTIFTALWWSKLAVRFRFPPKMEPFLQPHTPHWIPLWIAWQKSLHALILNSVYFICKFDETSLVPKPCSLLSQNLAHTLADDCAHIRAFLSSFSFPRPRLRPSIRIGCNFW